MESIDITNAARINNGLRELVYLALSFVPAVGGTLGAISNSLWPNLASLTVWEEVRADVERMCGNLIDVAVANNLKSQLVGFKTQYDLAASRSSSSGRWNAYAALLGDVKRESARYCDTSRP